MRGNIKNVHKNAGFPTRFQLFQSFQDERRFSKPARPNENHMNSVVEKLNDRLRKLRSRKIVITLDWITTFEWIFGRLSHRSICNSLVTNYQVGSPVR